MTTTPHQITPLKELHAASQAKQSVYCPSNGAFNRRIPAALMINMPGIRIHLLMEQGIFIYSGPAAHCASCNPKTPSK